jgi:hypothetical protein
MISGNNRASDLLAIGALDILIDNMDINNGEELKKRARKYMIIQGIVEPTDEEIKEFKLDQEPPPDPMQVQLIENVMMQTNKLVEEIKNTQADTQEKLYDTQAETVKTLETMVKALSEKVAAGGSITPEDQAMIDGQIAIVRDAQIDTLRTNELGGTPSIDMKEVALQAQTTGVPGGETPQGVSDTEYNPTGPTGPQGPRPAPQMPEGVGQ